MKVICIVDSISNIDKNLNLLSLHFGNSVDYYVKAEFAQFFKTYQSNNLKIYSKNPYKCIEEHMNDYKNEDLIVYRTSLDLDKNLLNLFLNKCNQGKVVNILPNYNIFEQFGNGIYNTYVKSMFKINDSLASSKLQFLPSKFVEELFQTSLSNRLFQLDPKYVINLYIQDVSTSKNLKIKNKFNRLFLIPIISALVITAMFILCLAFIKPNFLMIFVFVMLYLLNLVLTIIFLCKNKFDNRMLF